MLDMVRRYLAIANTAVEAEHRQASPIIIAKCGQLLITKSSHEQVTNNSFDVLSSSYTICASSTTQRLISGTLNWYQPSTFSITSRRVIRSAAQRIL